MAQPYVWADKLEWNIRKWKRLLVMGSCIGFSIICERLHNVIYSSIRIHMYL